MDEQRVNVRRTLQDPSYRYTMPIMRIKVEGRGKMIKTIILNLPDVAADVYRTPEYILRFFGFEFGASTQIDTKETNHPKYIIIGHRSVDELNNALDKFIENFVLCGTCKIPETVLSVKRGSVKYRCKACGYSTSPNPVHKLTKFICNHPPTSSEQDEEEPEKKKGGKKAENDEWSVETTSDAVAKRQKELTGESDVLSGGDQDGDDDGGGDEKADKGDVAPVGDLTLPPDGDPLALLSQFWKSNPSKEAVEEKVRKLQSDQGWSDLQLFNLVFGSLFDKNLEKNFLKKVEIMKIFVKRAKDQKQLLICVEKLCQMHPTLISHLPSILQEFYNSCDLGDDVIFEWYEEPPKKIPAKLAQQIREACLPFINWLETAEQEKSQE